MGMSKSIAANPPAEKTLNGLDCKIGKWQQSIREIVGSIEPNFEHAIPISKEIVVAGCFSDKYLKI